MDFVRRLSVLPDAFLSPVPSEPLPNNAVYKKHLHFFPENYTSLAKYPAHSRVSFDNLENLQLGYGMRARLKAFSGCPLLHLRQPALLWRKTSKLNSIVFGFKNTPNDKHKHINRILSKTNKSNAKWHVLVFFTKPHYSRFLN